MRTTVATLVWLLTLTGFGDAAASDETGQALVHNPFVRPAMAVKRPAEQVRSERRWRPELRATLVSGEHAMASMAGQIVELGEEIDGYRLVEVTETQATFLKDGERITVLVGSTRATKDND